MTWLRATLSTLWEALTGSEEQVNHAPFRDAEDVRRRSEKGLEKLERKARSRMARGEDYTLFI